MTSDSGVQAAHVGDSYRSDCEPVLKRSRALLCVIQIMSFFGWFDGPYSCRESGVLIGHQSVITANRILHLPYVGSRTHIQAPHGVTFKLVCFNRSATKFQVK